MAMRLWINGTEITSFSLSSINYSAPFKDTIDEELDELNIQVKSTTRQSFKKNDKLMYWIGHYSTIVLNKKMAIFNVVETWEGEKWLYQISCISPTKLLENIIINGMAETYASANLYAQIERVVDKINAQQSFEMSTYPQIIIDNASINSTIYNQAPSDFLWDGQMNAREILNDMLDKADAICIASDFTIDGNGNISSITIGAVKREKQGREIVNSVNDIENGGLNDVKSVVKGITFNRNSEFACGNIISLIKNGVAKDNVLQPYLPARNTDLTIDDASKWHLITQEPIYSLNSVKVMTDISNCIMRVKNPDDSTKYEINGIVLTGYLDITEYIVEKSVFDVMSLAEQKKHAYFIRGQKNIYGLYDRYKSGITGLFTNTAIENILADWNDSHFQLGVPLTQLVSVSWFASDKLGHFNSSMTTFTPATSDPIITGDTYYQNYGSVDDIVPENFYYNGLSSISGVIDDKNLLFSINYQPYCDSVVKIEKSNIIDLEANSKNLSILKNQSDRTIDATKYYDSQKALINRMGNKEMYLDAMIDISGSYNSTLTLWDLGDYFTLNGKKWTITQRTIENYNMGKLKVRYTLSKQFNASNVDIQINRDKRLYGIPLSQYVDRYIIIKNTYANSFDKLAIESWDDFTGSTTTQGFNILEMIKIGNSSITDRVARCYDNFAVDIERTKYNSTIVNVYTRYCDTDGYRQTITLYGMTNGMYNGLPCSDYSRLPFKPYSDGGATIEANGFKMQLTNIRKDKMERLIFVIKS